MKIKKLIISITITSMLFSVNAIAGKASNAGFPLMNGLKVYNGLKLYGDNFLTIQTLRSCLIIETEMDDREIAVDKFEKEIALKKDELDIVMTKIKNISILNLHSQKEVDLYNGMVADHQNKTNEYNVLIDGSNFAIDYYNDKSEEYNVGCAGKSYYLEDYPKAAEGLDIKGYGY